MDGDLQPCLHVETLRVPVTQPQTPARPRHQLTPGGPAAAPSSAGLGVTASTQMTFPFFHF